MANHKCRNADDKPERTGSFMDWSGGSEFIQHVVVGGVSCSSLWFAKHVTLNSNCLMHVCHSQKRRRHYYSKGHRAAKTAF